MLGYPDSGDALPGKEFRAGECRAPDYAAYPGVWQRMKGIQICFPSARGDRPIDNLPPGCYLKLPPHSRGSCDALILMGTSIQVDDVPLEEKMNDPRNGRHSTRASNCRWCNRFGWLNLTVAMDLFSRKVVGWAMAPHIRHAQRPAQFCRALLRVCRPVKHFSRPLPP